MSRIRFIRHTAAAIVLGSASLIGLTAQPAAAAVNIANCQFGYDFSRNFVSADCYNSTPSYWHLRLTCEKFSGVDHYVGGSSVYGSGTSVAQCGVNTEIVDETIINT